MQSSEIAAYSICGWWFQTSTSARVFMPVFFFENQKHRTFNCHVLDVTVIMPAIYVMGRKLLMSPSDAILPLLCGIVLHTFFTIGLILSTIYLYHSSSCTHSETYLLSWYLYSAIIIHFIIVITNTIAIIIGQNLRLLHISIWLSRALTLRAILNVLDIALAVFGIYLLIDDELDCLQYSMRALVMAIVIINWIILFIGCCGICCLSSAEHTIREHPQESLKTVCCACLWETRSWNNGNISNAFTEMGTLLEILRHTEHIEDDGIQQLAPSDIVVGLQLYRMLQKHYGLHDENFFVPFPSDTYCHQFADDDITLKIKDVNEYKEMNGKKIGNKKEVESQSDPSDGDSVRDPIPVPDDDGDGDGDGDGDPIVEMEEQKYEEPRIPKEVSQVTNSRTASNSDAPLLAVYGTFDGEEIAKSQSLGSDPLWRVKCNLHKAMQPRLTSEEVDRIQDGVYFTKYAIAAYGLPLYTLQYPCGICCAPPCCIPKGMTRDQIEGSACCGMSTIKVFLRRSGISGDDLLFASQTSGMNKITYFIAIDRPRKKLVIALRGSESMPDAMTDAACRPTQCPSIDADCYCHDGFRQSMLSMFESMDKEQRIQEFLANNKEFGIIVVGHSLGGGVTVLLTLQLLTNSGQNPNYDGRDIHGFGIAPPRSVSNAYADKMGKEMEQHLTLFIYGKDMIPRLTWNSIIKTKYAVLRMLRECQQSAWWVHRHGLNATPQTIVKALESSSKYTVSDNNGDVNGNGINYAKLQRVHQQWIDDLERDIKEMKDLSRSVHQSDPNLWDIDLQHIGTVFHIVNGSEVNARLLRRKRSKCEVCCSCLCTGFCNCIRCKCCNPQSKGWGQHDSFLIYRADPRGFDELLVSSRMASHHMPHVYQEVLESLDLGRGDTC